MSLNYLCYGTKVIYLLAKVNIIAEKEIPSNRQVI